MSKEEPQPAAHTPVAQILMAGGTELYGQIADLNSENERLKADLAYVRAELAWVRADRQATGNHRDRLRNERDEARSEANAAGDRVMQLEKDLAVERAIPRQSYQDYGWFTSQDVEQLSPHRLKSLEDELVVSVQRQLEYLPNPRAGRGYFSVAAVVNRVGLRAYPPSLERSEADHKSGCRDVTRTPRQRFYSEMMQAFCRIDMPNNDHGWWLRAAHSYMTLINFMDGRNLWPRVVPAI